jgi:hypothetical protein
VLKDAGRLDPPQPDGEGENALRRPMHVPAWHIRRKPEPGLAALRSIPSINGTGHVRPP